MTYHSPQAEAAWSEFRDGPDYTPTDRYPVQEVFAAGFDAALAVKREADREAVLGAVWGILANTSNYPKPIQAWVLGLDMGPLIHRVAEQVSGVIREAPPKVPHPALEQINAMHREKHGNSPRYASDDEREPVEWEPYVICDYDKTPWPCKTHLLLKGDSDA